MNSRKEDFGFATRTLFSHLSQSNINYRPTDSPKELATQNTSNRLARLPGLINNIDFMVSRIRSSVTPCKNDKTYNKISSLTPKVMLASDFLKAEDKQSPKHADNSVLRMLKQENSYGAFVRRSQDIAPLVFLKGQIEFKQIKKKLGFSAQGSPKIIRICIPKIINYSDYIFAPNQLALYILGVNQPVQKQSLNLQPSSYTLVLRTPIPTCIKPSSTYKAVEAEGQAQKRNNLKNINFVIVLKDQKSNLVLYWRNYLDPENLLACLKETMNRKNKIQQIY